MFPAVVVDLGSQVRPAEAAWVLAACNAAIVRGTCEQEAAADTPPRAVAIVRLQGNRQRVRIEVGLRESERGSWSVREIVFARRDPARERWRTVGLALATLVGEVEAAREAGDAAGGLAPGGADVPASTPGGSAPVQAETPAATAAPPPVATPEPAQPESAPAAPAAEPPAPEPPAPPPPPPPPEPPPPEPLEPVPVRRVIVSESDDLPDEPAAFPRHQGVFIGLGVLGSPAASGGTMPFGGALRAGYSLPSGWAFAFHADYSRAEFEPDDYALDTVRLMPGIAYRLSPSEHWSIGLAASAGVRGLWATSGRAGGVQQSAWSPLIAGSLELWWQAMRAGGMWSAFELGTIGRATRVRGLDAVLDAVVPAADARAFIGLWAAL